MKRTKHLIAAVVGCGLFVGLFVSSTAAAQEDVVANQTQDGCAQLLRVLGLTDGPTGTCRQHMTDMFWLDVNGDDRTGVYILKTGAVDEGRGFAAGAAWLNRIDVQSHPQVNATTLASGLAALGALPEGFRQMHAHNEDRPLQMRPFRLVLQGRYPVSPQEPRTDRGQSAVAPYHGVGGNSPHGRRQEQATLELNDEGLFVWSLAAQNTPGGPFETFKVVPCK